MSKGRGSFALAMSLSTQAKLQMNFQVSLSMKINPLSINDSNDINDSLRMTQIQKHCLSRLLVISVLNDSKMSRLLSRLFQFFF
jgi:predicted transcriptional regulator